ncbi:hypothetical protein WICMUC_003777 [Wickerhamomyces mucosus]|uniref:Abasic site processing protein n=1 Tax=Wickerhamomyces mucosus TaxID=1378264 RepID=A0A9P8PL16_9ASCO|nr:hypothetical protein WICMUC_003777 [Wickerhamomyces mucosus]
MNQYKTFNARKESVLQGNRLWKTVRNSTRCVIPVVGYYEWKHEKLGQGKKVNKKPYFIKKKDGELMFLAGLFSSVKFENDEEMHTFTIITGPAPKYMEWLHFRMPIILEPGTSAWDQWLSNEDYTDKIGQESLKEYGKEGFEWFEVSKDVGKTTNDGEYLIKPLLKGNIGDFFGKNEKNQMNKKIDEKVVKEEAKQENQLIGEDSHKGSDEEKHGLTEEKLKNQEETPVQKKEALKKENSETNERKRPKNISILDRLRSHTTKKQKT